MNNDFFGKKLLCSLFEHSWENANLDTAAQGCRADTIQVDVCGWSGPPPPRPVPTPSPQKWLIFGARKALERKKITLGNQEKNLNLKKNQKNLVCQISEKKLAQTARKKILMFLRGSLVPPGVLGRGIGVVKKNPQSKRWRHAPP